MTVRKMREVKMASDLVHGWMQVRYRKDRTKWICGDVRRASGTYRGDRKICVVINKSFRIDVYG